jgi:thiol-disulfide isomerase/thioredoxin
LNRLILLSLFILTLLFSSCETNPPTNPFHEPTDFGDIYIHGNVVGAEILINGNNSGKTTHATLTLPVGQHLLTIQKTGFANYSTQISIYKDSTVTLLFELSEIVQKIVLLEDFANVSCGPCVTSNRIIESLQHSYGRDKLAVIKYPTSFPSPVDPFYLANKTDSDNRRAYYNVNTAPTVVVDGFLRPLPQDSTMIKQRLDAQLEATPKFKIEVTDSINAEMYYVYLSVKLLNDEGIDLSELYIQTVVTETDIEFANPPGSNGETKFYNVMRAMLPTNQGEPLANMQLNQTIQSSHHIQINSNWKKEKLNCVVFIQNRNSKVIYQANSTF